ncbi:MAG: PRC-barrel domain-containing protein [Thermoplasmatota archaeon]
MLAKILEEYKIVNSVGEELGKVKEAYIDLDTWTVAAFEISPGMMKKHYLLDVSQIIKMDEEDKLMVVTDDHETPEVPKTPMRNRYPMDELKKLPVFDKDGEKVGKIYNLEVPYQKLKTFKVWKVLIKTGIKERRLRLSPNEIAEVMKEVRLKKSEKSYAGEEEK